MCISFVNCDISYRNQTIEMYLASSKLFLKAIILQTTVTRKSQETFFSVFDVNIFFSKCFLSTKHTL